MSTARHCISCGNYGGVLTCNGCKQVFCSKHVYEHRQELTNQLDGVLQEHDLLQEELNQSGEEYEYGLLEKLDQWEKETITKIQVSADAARADLREMVGNSKKRMANACSEIAIDIRSSRQRDSFGEDDLKRWTEQLNKLKSELRLSESIELIEDQQSAIPLITIREKNIKHDLIDSFSTVIRYNQVKEDDLLVVQTCFIDRCSYILGRELYSNGQEIVRLRIENITTPYNIFLGCFSPATIENPISFRSTSVVGWFGYNERWKHGIVDSNRINHGYHSDEIGVNDVLCLTFNCLEQQVELFHTRLNRQHILPVNLDRTPFPWQLLIVLTNENDSLRIFSSPFR